jgi:hypothetical protein
LFTVTEAGDKRPDKVTVLADAGSLKVTVSPEMNLLSPSEKFADE